MPCNPVFVDGLGVGDVGNIVLRDENCYRKRSYHCVAAIDRLRGHLLGSDIISRGFVYVRESEDLIESARKVAEECLYKCQQENMKDWGSMKMPK